MGIITDFLPGRKEAMWLGVREYIVIPPGQTPPPAATSLALPVDLPTPGAPWTKPAVQDALWIITDRRPIPPDASSAVSLCQMARQGCSGIYADFERPPGNAACRFLAALQAGLSQLRLPLLVPAAYAPLLPGAACVLSWQPGNGAFSSALQAACGRLAGRACFLDLAPVCCRVRLGKSAPPERLSPAALAEVLTGPVFYNAPLGCYYRLTHTGDALLCTLFDTAASFQARRSQAARLPLTGLLLLQPELDALSSAPDFEASAFSTQKPSYHLA